MCSQSLPRIFSPTFIIRHNDYTYLRLIYEWTSFGSSAPIFLRHDLEARAPHNQVPCTSSDFRSNHERITAISPWRNSPIHQ